MSIELVAMTADALARTIATIYETPFSGLLVRWPLCRLRVQSHPKIKPPARKFANEMSELDLRTGFAANYEG